MSALGLSLGLPERPGRAIHQHAFEQEKAAQNEREHERCALCQAVAAQAVLLVTTRANCGVPNRQQAVRLQVALHASCP